MKINKTTIALAIAGLSTVSVQQMDKAYADENSHTAQFTFDNNIIKNEVTGKVYSLPERINYVEGKVGNGLEINNSSLKIPLADLGIDRNTENVTLSFWMKWNGENSVIPIGFNSYDVWINEGQFGFNTGNGDIYGIENPFKIGEYTYVTLVFRQGDVTKNEMYINGVKQDLLQRLGNPINSLAIFDGEFNISGFSANDNYNLNGSIIDELNIFNRKTTPSEVQELYTNKLKPNNQNYMVKVIGTFDATTLDVKLPATSSFLFNPNTEEMLAQKLRIANDTNAPVYMNLKRIEVADNSTWQPALIAPNRYTDSQWRNLTQAQSKAEVALGLETSEDQDWLKGLENNHVWSASLNNTKIGVIKNHASIEAKPTLKAGTSLSTQDILTANYVFEFGLAE